MAKVEPMVQQALGSLAILFWIVVIGFFTSTIGMYVLAVIVALLVLFYSWLAYEVHEPWTVYDPPKVQRGGRCLIAEGRVDEGYFKLIRQKMPDQSYSYPYVLTLSYFDNSGKLTSTRARLIKGYGDNGRVYVGNRRGSPVGFDIDMTSRGDWFVSFTVLNNRDCWQVYPPLPDQEIWVSGD